MNYIKNSNDKKDDRKKKRLNFLMYIFLFLIFVSQMPVSFAEQFQKAKSETLANYNLDSQLGIVPKWELVKMDNGQPALAETYPFSLIAQQKLFNSSLVSIPIDIASAGVMSLTAGDGGYVIPGGLGVVFRPEVLQNASAMMMQDGGATGVGGDGGLTVGGPEVEGASQIIVPGGDGSFGGSEPPLLEKVKK